MSSRLLLNLAVILALSAVSMPGQTVRSSTGAPYGVERWGVEKGLPQNSVNALLQSPDGYLWMGTFGGLVRFDGVRFSVFERLSSSELRAHRVISIVTGMDSSLWIGTEGGRLYHFKHGAIGELVQQGGGVDGGSILALARDSSGNVWVGRARTGLWRIARKPEGGDTVLQSFVQPALQSHIIASILPSSDGLWVGGQGGVAQIVGAGIRTFELPRAYASSVVVAIAAGKDRELYFGTSDHRLFRIADDRLTDVTNGPFPAESPFDVVLEDGRADLQAALTAGALRFIDGKVVSRESPLWPGASEVHAFLKDREGNFWLGTMLDGLICIRRAAFEMITWPGANRNVTAMVRDGARGVWVGLNGGGVRLLRDAVSVPHPLTTLLARENVWSLLVDRRGMLWGGTWGSGLFRVDPDDPSGTLTWFRRETGFPSDVVLALREDPDGAVWAGTYDAGAIRIADGRFERLTTADGLPSNEVRAILRDSVGRLWFGTDRGLAVRSQDGTRQPGIQDGLPSTSVRVLAEGRRGTVWIGTYGGGVIRYRDGKFTAITTSEGMYDNIVSQFMVDQDDFAWMGSNRGIWKIPLEELSGVADGRLTHVTSVVYDMNDGLSTVETNGGFQPAGLNLGGAELWFPTGQGIARVKREGLYAHRTAPPVRIERIEADGVELANSGLVQIPAGTEQVRIQFTALSFTDPQRVRFRYQLQGYNKSWVDARFQREAVFTNVTPKTYSFRVIAANNEGMWNEEGAEVQLEFAAPYWNSWWFRTLAVMALVGMGMLVVSVRLRHVRLDQHRQEETSRRLIESQEEERQRIAGELHDSLGQDLIVAKNRVLLAAHHVTEDSPARQELSQVAEALTNALRNIRSIAYNLRPFQLDRLGLTETLRSTVRTIQQATPVVLETEIHDVDNLLPHDGEIGIFRIIQEALTNVVKHSSATRATVVVTRDEDAIVLRVEDDGIGFEHGAADGGRPVYGFGLSGIEERTRLLGGVSRVISAPGQGTKVAVRIPVRESREPEGTGA